MSSPSTTKSTLTPRARWVSFLEFAFGVCVVLAHNIFRILPNEVPILFLVGWISLRWRNGGWKYAGLSRPQSWLKTVALAILAAAILLLGSELIVEPISHRLAGTGTYLQCHPVSSIGLEAGTGGSTDCLDVCSIR
jgi:hypothetical protein